MIVVTVFLLIMNPTECSSVHNQKEKVPTAIYLPIGKDSERAFSESKC